MKYFVTGATGFVGKRVVSQLREQGHTVVALVRNPESAAHLAESGVILQRGDLSDLESLRAGMQGVDGVFHIAGWYKLGRGNNPEAVRVNVDGTRNVLETMRELQTPKGVYTSTVAVFSDTGGRLVDEDYRFHGRHLTQYDHTKAAAHYEVAEPMMQAGLPLVVVMPGVVYGPGDHSPVHELFVRYMKKKLPAIPRTTAYCWNHIDDTARAHLLAMEKGTPGESYVIAGPAHSLNEVLELANEITGIRTPRAISPSWFRMFAWLTSKLAWLFPLPDSAQPEALRAMAGVTYIASNNRARQELGYDPRPLRDGLVETLNAVDA
jgi:dihydroflavonol-4-reductase